MRVTWGLIGYLGFDRIGFPSKGYMYLVSLSQGYICCGIVANVIIWFRGGGGGDEQ